MMFNQYPYLNVNDLNLDYILSQIKIMMNEVTNFVSINAIKYADPIQWDITRQYEKNTVVIDPVTGTAYISVAPVPAGVALTRPEYWTVVFDLGSFVTRAAQNFTSRYEYDTTLTATFPSNTGEWLVWGDVLYKALTNITAGDTYVVDGNIEHFTIEDLYNTYLNTIAQVLAMIGDLADLTTSDTSSIVNAINSARTELLADTDTVRKSITVNAESDFIATQAWTVGSWLFIGSNLYEVTNPVSIGDALVVNTNIKAVTVEYLHRALQSAVSFRITTVRKSITVNYEDAYTATQAWSVGTWLYVGDSLYEVIAPISAGDALNASNIVGRTVEYFVDSVRNAVNAVRALLYAPDDITLFISDSYGEGAGTPNGAGQYTSFITLVKNALGMTEGVNAYTNAYGGSGFVAALAGKSFVNLLTELYNTVPAASRNKVTRIIVAGGYNDQGLSGIETAIATFCTTARGYFPNAKVYGAHIGWSKNISPRVNLSSNIPKWKYELPKNGGAYFANSEYLLHNYGQYFDNDGVHPNNAGQQSIANGIISGILTGGCDVDSGLTGFFTTPSSYISSLTMDGFVRMKNGEVHFSPNSPITAQFNSGVTVVSGAGYSLGTFQNDWILPLGNPNFNAIPVGGYAEYTFSGTTFYALVSGTLYLSGNTIQFKLDFVSGSTTSLQNLVDDVILHLVPSNSTFDTLMT